MARARPAHPARRPPRRPPRARHRVEPAGTTRSGRSVDPDEANANYAELGGKTIFTAQKNIVELLDGQGEDGRRAPSHHPPGQVLGERQEAARDRHLEPVVHPLPDRRRDHRAGQGPRSSTPSTCGSGSRTGPTASRATGTSPASGSSACRSRSGTRSTTTATSTTSPPSRPPRTCCRSTRPPWSPLPASTSRSATSRAGSPPTPTSWTRGTRRRCRRRSRRSGRRTPTCSSGSTRWTCAPRPTTSSARGCSPPSSRPTSCSTTCRSGTPPSPASSSTPTARSCRSRRTTPTTARSSCSSEFGADARPLLGLRRRPRPRRRRWTRGR